MWSTIPIACIDEYENRFPMLREFEREYILYSSKEHAFLPRHFYKKFPHPALQLYEDNLFKSEDIEINFTGELRPIQESMISQLSKRKSPSTEGIIKAFPGFGKTISSCYIASMKKTKTIIILDNSKILEQWVSAFLTFTDIEEDQIGLIKGTKIEVDKPIVIAMVQTLISKVKRNFIETYKTIRDAGFGLAIYDECHKTSSASKYATSSLFINAPNVIGLSATPYHTDLSHILMETTIGPIIYETKAYELSPSVYFIKYMSGLDQNVINKMNYFHDFIKQKAYYDKIILKSEKYLYVIHQLVKRLIQAQHQTFIICSTVAQVTLIHDMLISVGIDSDKLYSKNTEVNKESKVIVATYSYAGTGFDMKSLSALIYASPYRGRKSLIQTIGRILRRSEGKDKAIVFDLIDTSVPKLFKGIIPLKTKLLEEEFENSKFTTIDYT